MIGADEFLGVARQLAAELGCAMSATVFENIDRSVLPPGDDDGRWTDIRTDIVPRIRHFGFEGDVVPRAAVEDLLDLAFIDGLIGIDPVGNARQALGWPDIA